MWPLNSRGIGVRALELDNKKNFFATSLTNIYILDSKFGRFNNESGIEIILQKNGTKKILTPIIEGNKDKLTIIAKLDEKGKRDTVK